MHLPTPEARLGCLLARKLQVQIPMALSRGRVPSYDIMSGQLSFMEGGFTM